MDRSHLFPGCNEVDLRGYWKRSSTVLPIPVRSHARNHAPAPNGEPGEHPSYGPRKSNTGSAEISIRGTTGCKQINSSLESSSSSQEARLKNEISKVTGHLENLERSVRDTDTRLGRTNYILNVGLTEVRQDVQEINSSQVTSSNMHKARLKMEILNVEQKVVKLERSFQDTGTRLERTDNTIIAMQSENKDTKKVLTTVQRDIQTLNHSSLQLQGNLLCQYLIRFYRILYKHIICCSQFHKVLDICKYFIVCFKLSTLLIYMYVSVSNWFWLSNITFEQIK